MSGIELFSCDNIETYAAHVILCCQLMLSNVIDTLFVLFSFYHLLLRLYDLLGNVTLKKKMGRM